jgi:hypothetical protein
MNYEGYPLDIEGGSVPTDITELELKTQNISTSTILGNTVIDGNVTMQSEGSILKVGDVSIVEFDSVSNTLSTFYHDLKNVNDTMNMLLTDIVRVDDTILTESKNISELKWKTQNISDTTVDGTTMVNGDMKITRKDKTDTDIIAVGSLGFGLDIHVHVQSVSIGQTFIIHTNDELGVYIPAVLIPVPGWGSFYSKRFAIYEQDVLIFLSQPFRKVDCTITPNNFYRYQLPSILHLPDGNYTMTCSADANDAYFKRPVNFVYDPILIPVNINYSLTIDGIPTLERLTILEYNDLDLLYHMSFQYVRTLADSSVLSVSDIALKSYSSVNATLDYLETSTARGIIDFGYIYGETNLVIMPQPITNTFGYAYTIANIDLSKARILFLSNSRYATTEYHIDYHVSGVGDYIFDVDAEINFMSSQTVTTFVMLGITSMSDNDIPIKYKIEKNIGYDMALNVECKWSMKGLTVVSVTDPAVKKIRFRIQTSCTPGTSSTFNMLFGYNKPVRLYVQRVFTTAGYRHSGGVNV